MNKGSSNTGSNKDIQLVIVKSHNKSVALSQLIPLTACFWFTNGKCTTALFPLVTVINSLISGIILEIVNGIVLGLIT